MKITPEKMKEKSARLDRALEILTSIEAKGITLYRTSLETGIRNNRFWVFRKRKVCPSKKILTKLERFERRLSNEKYRKKLAALAKH